MGQALTSRKHNKKVLKVEPKEKYFIQNGGVLLKKRIALSQGHDTGAGEVKILSTMDIEKAANSYDPKIILGSSVNGMVYKGMIEDHLVAIRVPWEFNQNSERINFFLTEASTGMVMNHHNMVRLYGCCLETCIPILVYKFLSKGSLYERLHGRLAYDKSLTWADRLRIAVDVSYALSYMHCALPKPVVHRDVQSHNILLGDSFCAKLSNFGYSVSITPGETPKRWPIQGTPGYIDPEHIETGEVTDKCIVYSFGVLLLELLTRRYPSMMVRSGNGTNLVDMFVSFMGKNQMTEIMDHDVLDQACSDEIERVTQLALTCVAKKGVERPTMIEVVNDLRQLQGQHRI